MEDIVIVGAARTPIGKFLGSFAHTPASDLGAVAVRAALERSQIAPDQVTSVVLGNVISAGVGQAPARQAALKGGVPVTASALTVNKVCASGMQAVILGAQSIRDGDEDIVVAGGFENMTAAPHMLLNSRTGIRLGDAPFVDATVHDGLWCAFEDHHMGNAAEIIAEKYGITRDEQDRFSLTSHEHAIAAQQSGAFDWEMAPVTVAHKGKEVTVSIDECPRSDTSLEKLSWLATVFLTGGTVTAGNAPGITDGAAALVLTSATRARDLGARPLARITGYASVGNDPRYLFDAPALAVRKLLSRGGKRLEDFDLFEINEAFAAQVLANGRQLDWDWSRVNIHGGAIALGHPIGASGARIIVTLISALRQRGGRTGLATLCHGGGGAVALSLELL